MTHRVKGVLFAAGVLLAWTSGCEQRAPAPPQAMTAPSAQEGAAARSSAKPAGEAARSAPAVLKKAGDLYGARCAPCHGPKGAGDGPAAGAFQVRPRSFADPAWQAQVTDEDIRTITVQGGMAVGKSPAMPAAPDLARDERLDGLVEIIRGFGGR